MIFTSASILSLLAVVPAAVQAVPVFSHSDGLLPRQAANLQTQLSLDPSQVATGSEQDGQGADVADNQVRSKTSVNNFANFCLTQKDVPLTNGQQIKTGSCNPTIMGVIASTSNMPRSRFNFPKNGQVIQANTAFTLQMKIGNLQTGNFVNPNTNYYAAPQTVNGGGDIIGHSHVTIQKIDKPDSPNPLDPTVFAFFKGFNAQAKGGILTADVPAPGLPEGFYRMCSINTASNHQPVLVAVAQHGSLDDCVYFQCAAKASDKPFFDNGNNGGNGGNNGGNGGNNGGKGGNNGGKGGNNGGKGGNNGVNSASSSAATSTTAAPPAASGNTGGNKGGAQGNNGNKGGAQGNNGQKGGAQGNNGGANNNNNKGQAAQQAADKAKQEADAKKAAEDQKKAQDAAKAAAGANSKQAAAQQAADKAKQAADAKKAAEDQKKAQAQSNKGGKKNRRSLRFQRD